MDKNQRPHDNFAKKDGMAMNFVPDEEVTDIRLLSKEQRDSIFDRMVALYRDVKAGRISTDEAAAILVKPPYNIPGLRSARRFLDPGKPTP